MDKPSSSSPRLGLSMSRPINFAKRMQSIDRVVAVAQSIPDLATIAADGEHESLNDADSLVITKNMGPSPAGTGHWFTSYKSVEGIKSSGGKGHDHFLIPGSLGEIKNSGPSPRGNGHELVTVESLGNIKNSGPSPGGKGHEYPNAQSLGDIKNSGPSPRGKGHDSPNAKSMINNSGPSPGGKGHGLTNDEIHISWPNLGVQDQVFVNSVETNRNMKNSGPSAGGKT
ncbi:hypothetical protein L6452_06427 [Arctium lappa]|uniref:Uncharacterized protein n=1 Tax=Arctium lappa TaxID=4217 RepID=A0ACB9EJM8_ARCLA|nr:hypothetical protein L6452_06427 [Arctium lappa]